MGQPLTKSTRRRCAGEWRCAYTAAPRSAPPLPALSAAVQPNGKNHGGHQDGDPDADCGKAGSPEGRPDPSEEMPMSSPSSAKRRKYCHQRQGQHVQPLSSLHKTYRL
jgi:hypothetical protein